MKFLIWLLRLFGARKWAAALEAALEAMEKVETQEAQEVQEEIRQEVEDEMVPTGDAIDNASDSDLAEYFRTGKLPGEDGPN